MVQRRAGSKSTMEKNSSPASGPRSRNRSRTLYTFRKRIFECQQAIQKIILKARIVIQLFIISTYLHMIGSEPDRTDHKARSCSY